MRVYLYNSFSLGSGYQYGVLDKDNQQRKVSSNMLPNCVHLLFLNTLQRESIIKMENKAYLVLTNIDYANPEKRFDEQGRNVSINIAIEDNISKFDYLLSVLTSAKCAWKKFVTQLGNLVHIPYPQNELGYKINLSELQDLLDSYATNYPKDWYCLSENKKKFTIDQLSKKDGLIYMENGTERDFRQASMITDSYSFTLPKNIVFAPQEIQPYFEIKPPIIEQGNTPHQPQSSWVKLKKWIKTHLYWSAIVLFLLGWIIGYFFGKL